MYIFAFFKSLLLNKALLLLLLFLLVLLGCDKTKHTTTVEIEDSINYYYKKIEKETISQKEQIIYNNKILELVEKEENTINKRNNLDKLINNLYALNQLDKVEYVSNVLLKEAKKGRDSLSLAKAHRYIGTYFYKKTMLDSSFTHFVEAEKLYLQLEEELNYAVVLHKKGHVQIDVGDYFGADISLRKAYTILKNTENKEKLSTLYNSLGIVSKELNEYDRAIEYYNKALEVVTKNNIYNTEHLKAMYLGNIGVLYQKQGEHKKALIYFNEALKDKNLKAENPQVYSNILDNIGFSKLKMNDYNNTEQVLKKALLIRDSLKSTSYQILSLNHLSEYYYNLKDTTAAINFSNKAIKIAKKSVVAIDVVNALEQASLVDRKNASRYSKEYIRINDSLRTVERKNIDRFARIQLETDIISQQKDVYEEQANYLSKILVLLGSLAIIAFLTFNLRARNRELKLIAMQQAESEKTYKLIMQQQDQISEVKNNERTRIAREIHDGVLGRIFGLRINLDSIKNRSDNDAIEKRLVYFDELKKIEQHLREISHELSKENQNIINNYDSIINNLLQEQQKINKATVSLNTEGAIDWEKLSSLSKINLYRILQESLQNINKYANAKNIKIDIYKDKNTNLVLKIIDDGVGFDLAKKPNGIGLKNMITRAKESNGTFEIQSEKGKGTQIIVNLPLKIKNA